MGNGILGSMELRLGICHCTKLIIKEQEIKTKAGTWVKV